MRPTVVTLPSVIDLASLLSILNDPSHLHSAFPVIDMRKKSVKWLSDHGWHQKDGHLIGTVLRWHILLMLKHRAFSELNDPTFKRRKPKILHAKDLTDRVWKNKRTIFAAEFGLAQSELSARYIDFTPLMSLSPTAVLQNTPVLTLYAIFKGLGLRHLIVIGQKRQIVGIITTHELSEHNLERAVERVHAHFEGLSESQQNALFEQRIAYLKGINKRLASSGNAWLEKEKPNSKPKETANASLQPGAPDVVEEQADEENLTDDVTDDDVSDDDNELE